ncbi:MAG: polyphosphate polymerase domain-containing protein [Butyricicoccus sp.]|nr:polyphosphate polymerase domain-containing protein [Butyricicoccus sp.]MBQ8586197.1 polyphosphate polymerase domain-containing protein [Butyricicoccus sp.]
MKLQPRQELKHEISYGDYLALRHRLLAVMPHDPYAGADGIYTVHSLYFDNFADAALREKMDGKPQREKFRIRYYRGDPSFMHLEKKCKINGVTMKYMAEITEAEVRALLTGDTAWMKASERGLVRELYAKMQTQLLRPRTAVEYIREPLMFEPGHIRITFDQQISAGPADERFLVPHTSIPANHRGTVILEIKYDHYLPAHIAALLQMGDRTRQSYSKYEAARTLF